ncbi:hypothetical protein AC626_18100 [Pseudoalteromonas rubra]|uniref:PKD domain-containing protein n=1 Tax=Pseudoalteromonas rubra TaxID=43658 RepID=A0A0L0EPE2_9GAMM|nr:hypothetical protein AC626_18100 [Pseudoalteromonas rubra]
MTLAAALELLDTNITDDDGNISASVTYRGGVAPVAIRWDLGDGTLLNGLRSSISISCPGAIGLWYRWKMPMAAQ